MDNRFVAFINEEDVVTKIEILLDTFGLEGIKDRFGIEDLTEEYIEYLDVFTAFDFIDMYEDYIIKKWKKML